jgi:hypothetical protein
MMTRRSLLPLVLLLWSGAIGCRKDSGPNPAAPQTSAPIFREASKETGLEFEQFAGVSGKFYFPEITGSGVALLDYDGDGDLDVFLVQAQMVDPAARIADALLPPPKTHWPGHRLFRNNLIPGGKLNFTDVTETSGIKTSGYGMGAATGDYDNDGHTDLFVTQFGSNILYHNNGDGTFTDVTHKAGLDDTRWSTSAAFLDYDRDGYLDLIVAHYVDFSLSRHILCHIPSGEAEYCGPLAYRPVAASLFHNDGHGHFTDVSTRSGITAARGNGLGVVVADYNGDGWPDIYVANDQVANFLWINQRNGTFRESGVMAGAAYSQDGKAESSMGVDAGDFDNDGDEDLFMSNLRGEKSTLYVNNGKGEFLDLTNQFRLEQPSHLFTGFGAKWFDYDQDGWLDLFQVNGDVGKAPVHGSGPFPYHQTKLLLHNEQGRGFRETTREGGPALSIPEVSRGAAFGDIDNDGDLDIVVANSSGPARLLLNDGAYGHWLQVELQGSRSNRMGIGARVGVRKQNQSILWRRASTDGSYLSANDHRVHFGLGESTSILGIVVQWPSGLVEEFLSTAVDRLVRLKEGAGTKH